jgi:hypothetical protein
VQSAVVSDARLDVPFSFETLDSSANRTMLVLLRALIRRGRALRLRLQQRVDNETESETRTALVNRWPVRKHLLEDLTTLLVKVAAQHPFGEVQRAELTASGLTAVAADPAYARAWGRGWRALRHGFESDDRSERLWISPSWEIYERWCFLALGKQLEQRYPDWNWHYSTASRRWRGTRGGSRAELLLQPTFRSNAAGPGKMWSVSRERVPDIVLTADDGNATKFVVFDAKYRTTRANVLDAMESAHIYQDRTRGVSRRSSGGRSSVLARVCHATSDGDPGGALVKRPEFLTALP